VADLDRIDAEGLQWQPRRCYRNLERTRRGWSPPAACRQKAGAVPRELGDQRLDRAGQAQPTLVKRVAGGQHREQVAEAMADHREEPLVRSEEMPIIA
jgi:hypothetical protein